MSGVDASIPLSFQPTQNLGPNIGSTVLTAEHIMALREQQRQAQSQNALKQILSMPGALDATGNPTPDTLQKVASVDPGAMMKLRQNMLMSQQRELQTAVLKSNLFQKQSETEQDIRQRGVIAYEQAKKSGLSDEQANQAGQSAVDEGIGEARKSGLFPERQLANPKPFNYQGYKASSMSYEEWLRQQNKERDEGRADKREQRMDASANQSGWTLVTQENKDGTKTQYWTNPRTSENKTLSGKPFTPDDEGQVAKVGTEAKKPTEGSTGATLEALYDEEKQKNPSGTPAQWSLAARKRFNAETAKEPAAGSLGAEKLDVRKDVRQKHPDWSDAQVDLEADRQIKDTGKAKVGLTPDALDMEARMWLRTGQMSFGMGGKEDREAVYNRAAEIAKAEGKTVDDYVSGRATLKADTQSLGQLTKVRDAATAFEKGAQKEFNLVLTQIPKTPEPLNSQAFTRWVRTGERQFGDIQVPRFQVALISALDEYAKVLAGNYGIGGSTDASREQALSVIPPGATSAQIPAIVDIIQKSMRLKTSSYDEQLNEIRKDIASPTGDTRGTVSPPTDENPPPYQKPADPGVTVVPPVPSAPASLAGKPDLQWSPSRRQWRDSSGKLYDADGNPVQ